MLDSATVGRAANRWEGAGRGHTGPRKEQSSSFGGAGGVRRPSALPTYTARRAKSPSRRGFGAVLSMAWHQGRAVAGQPLTRRWLQAGTYLWPWLLVTMVCICVRAYGSPSTLVPADTASAADAAAGARGGPPPGHIHPSSVGNRSRGRGWLHLQQRTVTEPRAEKREEGQELGRPTLESDGRTGARLRVCACMHACVSLHAGERGDATMMMLVLLELPLLTSLLFRDRQEGSSKLGVVAVDDDMKGGGRTGGRSQARAGQGRRTTTSDWHGPACSTMANGGSIRV